MTADMRGADTTTASAGGADEATLDALAASFRRMAELEFAPESPLYERLAYAVAERPDLLAPLLAAPRTQRRALLYFAAVAYLLRTVDRLPRALVSRRA